MVDLIVCMAFLALILIGLGLSKGHRVPRRRIHFKDVPVGSQLTMIPHCAPDGTVSDLPQEYVKPRTGAKLDAQHVDFGDGWMDVTEPDRVLVLSYTHNGKHYK